jgi:predicted dehydrogenase
MAPQTRRTFIRNVATVAGAATSISLAGRKGFGQVMGSNERVNVAVVGFNGRGGSHLQGFGNMPNVRIAGLCDIDSRVLERGAAKIEKVQTFQDYRKLMETKDIDVVTIATCNHTHSLIAIAACQAGKDVYVEKPCSHNPFEGRKLVEAARKYSRIVQHGTQSRTEDRGWYKLAALVKSGKYGKLLVSRGYASKPRWSIGYKPFKTPPDNVDFNIWLGPAPEQPYHENLVHYSWHWFWDTGCGEIGNQGVHQMDVARWITGQTLPKSVTSLGGRWVDTADFRDQGQTPNQQVTVMEFPDGAILLFEANGLCGGKLKGKFDGKVTNEAYFEAGAVKGNQFFPKGKTEGEPLADVEFEGPKGGGNHFANFMAAVRSRKPEDLNAEILQGHLSAACCHLGNIAYRFGGPQKFEVPESLAANEVVRESIQYMLDNVKAIGVEPDKATLWVGPKLEFDPEAEKFVNNKAADAFLTRPYRAPFVVPDKV